MLANKVRQKITTGWPVLANVLHVPHTKEEYQETITLLDSPIDEIGEAETHPLAPVMEVLGVLIEKYEDEHLLEIAEV